MKKPVLLFAVAVILLSTLGAVCSIANCRYFCGFPDDFYDLPDGRIFFGGVPPYPYIPTVTPKEPFPIIPLIPEGFLERFDAYN